MMFKNGFSIPTIMTLVLLAIVTAAGIFRAVSLKREADAMRKAGPNADSPVQLIGLGLTSIQVMVLMTLMFILLVVAVGSFIFSNMRYRQVSFLTMYWVAVFSPVAMFALYIGAAKLGKLITARAVGNMNQNLPPAEVVKQATETKPVEPKPAGVENYSPTMLRVF